MVAARGTTSTELDPKSVTLVRQSESVGLELEQRLRAVVIAKTTEMADDVMRVPLTSYRDPDRLEAEVQRLFRDGPFVVAASAQLPGPSTFLTIEVVDRLLLVTRDSDGRSHVVLNYCRHRGAVIARGSGAARRHVCPYHAWTYDPTGVRVGLPGPEGFDGLDACDTGLVELPSRESHGFVWTALDPASTLDLDNHLGPMGDELDRFDYGQYFATPSTDIELATNWKSTLEAFNELYHIQTVHPASISPGIINNTITFDPIGLHHRIGTAMHGLQEVVRGARAYDPVLDVTPIYWVNPNLVLANTRFGVEVIQITPSVDPMRSRLRHTFMAVRRPRDAEESAQIDAIRLVITNVVTAEDKPVLDLCGRGLTDGAHQHVLLGRNEPGCQNVHRQIDLRLTL